MDATGFVVRSFTTIEKAKEEAKAAAAAAKEREGSKQKPDL